MPISITRDEAIELVKNTSKYSHSIRVANMMKKLATYFNEDQEEWELVGLLHDLDYDNTIGTRQIHGIIAGEMLHGKLSSMAIEAIKSHDYRTRIEPKNRLARMLIACDAFDTLIELMKHKEMDITKIRIEKLLETWTIEMPWLKELIKNVEYEEITIKSFIDYCLSAIENKKKEKLNEKTI